MKEYEQEYIEIFERNRALIEEFSAHLLNAPRTAALARFKATGFPGNRDEEWLHTKVADRFATDYGMNLGRVLAKAGRHDMFTCDVPNLNTYRAYIVNDSFVSAEKRKSELPGAVIFGSLNEIASQHPGLLEPFYNTLAVQGDSIAQFNTVFTQDGVVLYIPDNTIVEETIQLVSLLQANVEIMSNRRILVVVGENSKASLLMCDHSSHTLASLSTQVTEIFLARGASLDVYELEETSNSNTRLSHMFVEQSADSRFNHCNLTLTNGFTRNYIHVAMNGTGAEATVNGLAIGDGTQHVNNRTLVDHKAPHCTSSELYKYILDEQSTGVFAGKMLIRPDAQHTDSHQINRNLCLTGCARMYAQPQLEIYADDVKCSHGSTVGQLDENALFYMRQRGIPADEARHLLMYAFAGEVVDTIAIEALRDRLHLLVEKRFRGELNRCRNCGMCK